MSKGALLAVILSAAGWVGGAHAACVPLHEQIEFCDDGATWQRFEMVANETLAMFRFEDKSIGKLIVEKAAPGQRITAKMVEDAIIEKVGKQSAETGVAPIDVQTREGGRIGEHVIGTVQYEMDMADMGIVQFHHSYLVGDALVVQFVTLSNVLEHDMAKTVHQRFIERFEISKPETLL
ncbi:hypothetical protein [Litoreibacter roseus]|uniref:DUF1795 domain-containing protein n=1 Tax=Litoreibacter roseus TaxID=2601869 RepID=A0A6N6JDR3_9RHOB|nr:hypothetical protein [Litoreibacter roseus]GFE64295.1 hypothetical protein KIN_13690 [Litoreibacter roseus]